jgi:MFS transporter, ACDE family, multidrug resistance protein
MSNTTANPQQKSPTNIFQDKNFYIINFVTLMGILGGTLYNPALPTIQRFFNVTTDQASWTSTIYQLPSAVITPIFGILADTLGRKQILLPSLLLFAFGGAFSGLASNFTAHLGWRFVQGIGAASLEPLQLTIIGDLYRGRVLGTAMAFNAGLIGMSGAIFPLMGGFLAAFDWRYTFLLALLAIPIAFSVITTLRLPRQNNTKKEKFELKSYLKVTWKSVNNRHVLGLLFAVLSLFLMQTLCLTYIPFLAADKFRTSEVVNGMLLASMSVSMAIIASQLGNFVRIISEIKLIKLSFLLFAIALVLFPLVPNFWFLLIPMFLLGAAQGIALPSSQALLAGLSAQESRAGFMAINTTIMSWGQTLGPFVGSLAVRFWEIQSVFYTSAIFSVVSFAIFNYFLTTKVLNFTAKTIQLQLPTSSEAASESSVYSVSNTIAQQPVAQLYHVQTHRAIELPEHFQVVNIGKSSVGKASPKENRNISEVDLADLPNAGVVSRLHAQIRFDGEEYYIQDMNSTNGTYINKYPMIPGVWYKLKPGLRLGFGRRDAIAFVFQLV